MNQVVETVGTLIENQRNQFNAVVSVKHINFDREAQFAKQILGNPDDYIHKVALTNKASLVAAINNVAAIGISLNPASKLAYLVPRKGAICLDISYMGVMHVAQVSGAIKWGQAKIVHANDTFELKGVDEPPVHTYNPFEKDRGKIVGCYVVVKTADDDYLTHSMTIEDIKSIRDRSESWKARLKAIAQKKTPTQTPWETDFEEMAKKTVVKQASKYWPRREHLDGVVHYLNDPATEGIDFAKDITSESTETKSIAHSPIREEVAEMSMADQQDAEAIAIKVTELLDEGYEWEAHDKVYNDHVSSETRIAIWNFLGQKKTSINGKMILYRSIITKCHDAEQAGQRPEDQPPKL